MTETTIHFGFTQQGFDAFLDSRNEPVWLTDMRREAWRAFCEMDWPSRRDEEWMRTDIRLFKLSRFGLPVETAPRSTGPWSTLLDQGVDLAGSSRSLDSHPLESSIQAGWAEQGVVFGSMDCLVREHGALLKPYLAQSLGSPYPDKFAALHAACWSGGHLLYVPRDVVVDQPLHTGSALSGGASDLGHILVILEPGAQATVLTETSSTTGADSGFHCGATRMFVGPRAHLRYVNLQDWSHGVWHFAHQHAAVGADASLQWTTAALGARLAKVNQHVRLAGERADCQVNGVMFAEGRQHVSYHTLQHHEAPGGTSDFLYKAALQDRARTVWRGMIRVEPEAQKTDGYQRNDSLLLSGHARADSIPGLEIEADDVRCSHGATAGRVDEEQVFYACCRGFTRREAIRLIVTGFFQQVFDRITIESVRNALAMAIARRIRDYD